MTPKEHLRTQDEQLDMKWKAEQISIRIFTTLQKTNKERKNITKIGIPIQTWKPVTHPIHKPTQRNTLSTSQRITPEITTLQNRRRTTKPQRISMCPQALKHIRTPARGTPRDRLLSNLRKQLPLTHHRIGVLWTQVPKLIIISRTNPTTPPPNIVSD
jgi:hypothetical protein